MNKCKYIKPDGTKCNAFAVKDDIYCFAHSKKHKKEHKEAVLRGGKSLKRSYTDKRPILLRNRQDAVYLLEKIINEVRANKISTKTASILAMLINISIKTIPQALSEKSGIRNIKNFNAGKTELKLRIERLDEEVRYKK